jgi:predicted MPP superfamily phosphohydrolase
MKKRINRRAFIFGAMAVSPGLVCADASWLEPHWVKVRHINIAKGQPTHRIAHITDIHHKGDRAYLETVVEKINAHSPDAVCFTGDLIEQAKFIPETLEVLKGIKSPLYGVPGNHDYWSHASFAEIGKAFASTGGSWLMDEQTFIEDGKVQLTGVTCQGRKLAPLLPGTGVKNIMMLHYPLLAERVTSPFDLLLAGHSHGGQIRIPFYGAIMLPYWVGPYEMGMFRVPAGRLYVNPGIGWLGTPVRFNCRPEITLFDI